MSYYDRPAMIALGASGAAPALRCPSADEPPASARRKVDPRPAVDERLIVPGTRHEVVEGQVLFTPPAGEEHGTARLDLAYLLGSYVVSTHRGAVDMLTRTKEVGDHAPDASVFSRERDAQTGGRKLEELAFEIVSEQAMSVPTAKARDYIERGVRRVFCIDVGKHRAREWSREEDGWQDLSPDAFIADPCFVKPLAVRALIDAALVDDTVAEGLIAKKNRVIERAVAASARKAMAEALLLALDVRNISLSNAERALIMACSDREQLDVWMRRAVVATRASEVWGKGA